MRYRNWLFIAIALFLIGLVLGFNTPASLVDLFSNDISTFSDFADTILGLPQIAEFFIIFLRNASVVLVSFVLSPLLGILPLVALFFNGWFLGLISVAVLRVESFTYLLAGILPHGIFEIPALIIAEAVCLSFGATVVLAAFRKEKRELVIPNLKQNLKYMIAATGMLFVAAIIETWVTPLLLGR